MYNIQANASGTRCIEINDRHLLTIKKYNLLEGVVSSNGIIDDTTLERLQLGIRALLENNTEDSKQLFDLCFDVIYHKDMKLIGLRNLIALYKEKINEICEEDENIELPE